MTVFYLWSEENFGYNDRNANFYNCLITYILVHVAPTQWIFYDLRRWW